MGEMGPTAPGDETIGRLREEVEKHGTSKSAKQAGHDPSAAETDAGYDGSNNGEEWRKVA